MNTHPKGEARAKSSACTLRHEQCSVCDAVHLDDLWLSLGTTVMQAAETHLPGGKPRPWPVGRYGWLGGRIGWTAVIHMHIYVSSLRTTLNLQMEKWMDNAVMDTLALCRPDGVPLGQSCQLFSLNLTNLPCEMRTATCPIVLGYETYMQAWT